MADEPTTNQPIPEAETVAVDYMDMTRRFLGASSDQDALARLQGLQRAFTEARAVLSSIYVVSVIMGGGEALGIQLPAGRHTEDSLEQMADGLLQGAMHLRDLAKAAKLEAQAAARKDQA